MRQVTDHSLRGIGVLQSLSEGELGALEQRCRWRGCGAGEQILDRSTDNRDVFFVVQGSVRAVDFSLSGREVVYAVIGAGGHFGELSAIDGLGRSASVVAIEHCLLAALTPTQFESLIRSQPDVAIELLRDLVRIIRTTDERLTEVSTLGTMARVCRELLRLARADERSGDWRITPLPTQKEIAGRAGTARETVARTLSHLTREAIVERAPAGPCASWTGPRWKRRARALRAWSRARARRGHLHQMRRRIPNLGLGAARVAELTGAVRHGTRRLGGDGQPDAAAEQFRLPMR